MSAKDLLCNYTSGTSKLGSFLKRVIKGHWNHHHVREVIQLINDIENNTIPDIESLMPRLTKINLENQQGSLGRRIDFIFFKYSVNHAKKPELQPTPEQPSPSGQLPISNP